MGKNLIEYLFFLWGGVICPGKTDIVRTKYFLVFHIFHPVRPQFGTCIKHKLLTALDRINEQPEMELFDGVRLVKDPATATAAGTPNDVPRDSSAGRSASDAGDDPASLDSLVVDKAINFFKSRSLQFKLLDNEPRENGKSVRETPRRDPLPHRVWKINNCGQRVRLSIRVK